MSLDAQLNKISGSIVDLIYSKKKRTERIVFLLMLFGLILRIIAANNLGNLADDAVYASQSAEIWSANILSTHSNPPLFFYLTDLSYKLLGYGMLGSRFFVLISGALLIVVVFLLAKRLFNEKVALASAFFVTFSNFLIRMTFTEQSLMVLFFLFLATYTWIIYLDTKNKFYFFVSAAVLGLALLTKYNAPFFIASLFIFSVLYLRDKKEKLNIKKNVRIFIVLLLILLLFSMPFLAFNYFIYKEKGILDVYFSRVVQLRSTQQLYGGLAGQENSFFDNAKRLSNYGNYNLVLKTDILLFLFGLGGLFLWVRRKEKIPLFFFFSFLVLPFVLQSAGSPLPKHFAFMHLLFSLPAGYCLNEIVSRIKSTNVKMGLILALTGFFIFNIGFQYLTPPNFISPSANSQAKNYLSDNVHFGDLIVFDPRIYTSQSYFLATPNNFMNLIDFINLYNQHEKIPTNAKTSVQVFFVECVPEDCGWGTIKDQPDLNKTTEEIFKQLSSSLQTVQIINSKNYAGNEFFGGDNIETYKIYKGQFQLNYPLVEKVNEGNGFYFVPYLYKDMSSYIYKYDLNTLSQHILDFSAHLVLKISVFLAILVFFLPLFLLANGGDSERKNLSHSEEVQTIEVKEGQN